jgi:excisionase family DNA binding protein
MTEPETPDTLTPKELAALAGMHPKTIRQWCREGRIPARRIGGTWRIKPDVLAERDPDLWEEYLEGARRRRAV